VIKKLLAITVLVLVASLSMAGCTNTQNNTASGQTSQVNAYADAFHKSVVADLGPNDTITSWVQNQNGTDAMRLQWTDVNSTHNTSNILYPNGTTTTYSVNVKQFASKDDATSFYDNVSFGYTTSSNVSLPIKPQDNIYEQVMGHNSTTNNGAWKLESFNFINAQVSFIVQQDEFVTYGSISVMPK